MSAQDQDVSVEPSIDDTLGVVDAAFDATDPVALARSFVSALQRAALRPGASGPALLRFGAGLVLAGAGLGARLAGLRLPGAAAPNPRDSRFTSKAWEENPFFHMVLESYLLTERLILELVNAAGLEPPAGPKAEFAAQLVADALAPTNFLPTNPDALVRAFETGGASLVRGARNLLHDVTENGGWPSQVDRAAFTVGVNLAVTPGKVVFRNELVEVLQYDAQTDDVNEIPLLVCPPWINRYYIADLAPGKSLVEWAIQHGHTVFAISYRNPDSSMRDLTFDDYLRLGPLTAIDVAREIAGSSTVNTLAICLGGTMNAMVVAYLDACGDHLVNSSTYLNAAVDYAGAGDLASVFADRDTLQGLVRRMEDKGYVDGKEIAHTFDLLRANDLVFRYVVHGWLMGESPPAFDLLAWNADSTNMPGKAHAHFIRSMYLENALATDRYTALGEQLLVSEIASDSYIVAAVEDHIVPWRVSYRTTQLFKGAVRFVLTSSGHIAGIVNPPSPKARLWTNDDLPPSANAWFAGAEQHHETWWNDWVRWLGERAGGRRRPPATGSDAHPVLGDAPGTYVRT